MDGCKCKVLLFLIIILLRRQMNGLRKLQFFIKGYFNFTKRS
jgi:hypothetical protein